MHRLVILVASALLALCLAMAAAPAVPPGSLAKAQGRCGVMGGETAFYVCHASSTSVLPDQSGGTVTVRLLHGAHMSNGGTGYTDDQGLAQIVMPSGHPFGANAGVEVTGKIRAGSVVYASFTPRPGTPSGYAVWHLRRASTRLRLDTSADARSATLVVDGRRLTPVLYIPPAVLVHDAATRRLFIADMRHLAAVVAGNPAGACEFLRPRTPEPPDSECARVFKNANPFDIRQAVRTLHLYRYNGFVLAQSTASVLVLDRGHFRLLEGYRLV